MITPTGQPGEWRLSLTAREHELLQVVLKVHPATPENYHQLSRSSAAVGDALLDRAEALRREFEAQHRCELRDWTGRFLERLAPSESGGPATTRLTSEELDQLLQALNEARVGCWVALGCPHPLPNPDQPAPELGERWRFVMEVAGYFETRLLDAFEAASASPPAEAGPPPD